MNLFYSYKHSALIVYQLVKMCKSKETVLPVKIPKENLEALSSTGATAAKGGEEAGRNVQRNQSTESTKEGGMLVGYLDGSHGT